MFGEQWLIVHGRGPYNRVANRRAQVAQLVEHISRKDEVAGSSPALGFLRCFLSLSEGALAVTVGADEFAYLELAKIRYSGGVGSVHARARRMNPSRLATRA